MTFKYPKEWQLTEPDPEKNLSLSVSSADYKNEGGDGDHPGKGGAIYVDQYTNGNGTTTGLTADNFKSKRSGGDKFKSYEVFIINGKKVVQFQSVSYAQVVTVFFLKDDTTYSFSLKYAKDDYSKQFDYYNKIISSVTLDK